MGGGMRRCVDVESVSVSSMLSEALTLLVPFWGELAAGGRQKKK